jgi:hypothetical protein
MYFPTFSLFCLQILNHPSSFSLRILIYFATVLLTASITMVFIVQSDRLGRVGGTPIRIRDVPSSILGLETVYPNCDFYGFTQSVRASCGVVSRIGLQPLPATSLFTYDQTIQLYVV